MITAQLATIPERIEVLPIVIDSLYKQVDRLNVILNGFDKSVWANFCNQQILCYPGKERWMNVVFIHRDNQMTDGEKYFNIENCEPGYIFTCDDDLEYKPGYVQYLIQKIEQYKRKAVITLHGRCFSDFPIYSFYRDRAEINPYDGTMMPHDGDKPVVYRCLAYVADDHRVHCGGDGVMAWHTDTLKMKYQYVELPNMAQLWMALVCNRFNIPQIVAAHPEGLVEAIWDGPGIWDKENQHDGVQTRLINERWLTDKKREYYQKNSGE